MVLYTCISPIPYIYVQLKYVLVLMAFLVFRHMRDAKKHGNMSKVILGMKKGRKKILCKDGAQKEADQQSFSNG